MIDRLREDCPVALAVSLHAPNDALRDELVPLNRKYPLRELLGGDTRVGVEPPAFGLGQISRRRARSSQPRLQLASADQQQQQAAPQ